MFLCNNAQPASEFSNWQVVNTFLQLINKKIKASRIVLLSLTSYAWYKLLL